jgi:hypothetical protein
MAERGRMNKRLFTDRDIEPSDRLLVKQLGNAVRFYRAIAAIPGRYQRRWQFNRGNGWILRAHDAGATLYYLIAFDGGVEISLTISDSERDDFLKCGELERSHPQLAAGTKYVGGYAVRFEVEDDLACRSVSQFLAHLMKTRIPLDRSLSLKRIKKTAKVTKRLVVAPRTLIPQPRA